MKNYERNFMRDLDEMLKSYNLISVQLPSSLTYRLQLIPEMLLESRVHVDERWQTPSPSSS